KLKKNYTTFQACHRALSAGKAIMILVEGRCIHEKRLRELRKGAARIALGALAADPDLADVPIVPVGVNYTGAERIRSAVLIKCGQPISTKTYLSSFHQQENQAIQQLTQEIREGLSPLVIQIPQPEEDDLAEALFRLDRTNHKTDFVYGLTHTGKQFVREVNIVKNLPLKSDIVKRYFHRLAQLGLEDPAVAGAYAPYLVRNSWGWLKTLLASFILLWYFPLWIVGEYIGGTITRAIEYYAPIRFAVMGIATIVYFPLWFIGLNPFLMVYAILSMAFVQWAWKEWEASKHWFSARMAWRQTPTERERLEIMREAAMAESELVMPVSSEEGNK
ncbi:MAG: 1-acyl-sn-glycerol-3-phosphate acyltransferase, partial [Bacteroidota bacterium]